MATRRRELYDDGSLKLEVYYKNGLKHGRFKLWNPPELGGRVNISCNYRHNDFHGRYREWHNNGQLNQECYYQNGLLHGRYREWHENGRILQDCSYRNGSLHGRYRRWNLNGVKAVPDRYYYTDRDGLLFRFLPLRNRYQ